MSYRVNLKSWLGKKPCDLYPFQWAISNQKLTVNAPSFSRIAVRSGFGWSQVLDGSQLGLHGGVSKSPLSLSFPIGTSLKFSLQGKSWLLENQEPKSTATKNNAWFVERTTFVWSLACHVFVLALFYVLTHFSKAKEEKNFATLLKEEKLAELVQLGAGLPQHKAIPFGGVSFAQYLDSLSSPTERLTRLTGKLSQLKFGKGSLLNEANPRLGNSETLLKNVPSLNNGSDLVDEIRDLHFQLKEDSASVAKISAADKAVIRERFHEIQEEFRRVYNRVLLSDPQFSVTVGFEVTVGSNGFLSLTGFSPRGQYRASSLSQLRSGMAHVVSAVRLKPQVAQTVVRGESVFIKQ